MMKARECIGWSALEIFMGKGRLPHPMLEEVLSHAERSSQLA